MPVIFVQFYFTGAPEWEEAPENQEKSTNEKAVFNCYAKYAAEYKWLVNGVPLTDSEYNFISASMTYPAATSLRFLT